MAMTISHQRSILKKKKNLERSYFSLELFIFVSNIWILSRGPVPLNYRRAMAPSGFTTFSSQILFPGNGQIGNSSTCTALVIVDLLNKFIRGIGGCLWAFSGSKLPHLDHRELLGVEPWSKMKTEAVKKSSITAYCFIDLKLFSHLRKLYPLKMNFSIVQTIRDHTKYT